MYVDYFLRIGYRKLFAGQRDFSSFGRCHVRTSANSDSFGAQNHVNNVIDVDGTSYIADVSMGSKHIICIR